VTLETAVLLDNKELAVSPVISDLLVPVVSQDSRVPLDLLDRRDSKDREELLAARD